MVCGCQGCSVWFWHVILDLNLFLQAWFLFCLSCPVGDTFVVALQLLSDSYCLLRTHPGIQQWNKDTTLSRRHSLLLASHPLCSSSSHQHILDSLNRYGVKYLYYFFQNCWGIKCVVNNYFNCFKVNFGYLLYVWTPSFGTLLKMYFQIHFWRKKKHYMKYFFFPFMKMLILEDT